jgi:FkbM family methyltransferase
VTIGCHFCGTILDDRLGPLVEAHRERFGLTADVIFDVGTRDGDDAHYLQTSLNAVDVVAVDANPLAVERTRSAYPGFHVLECAVSDVAGRSEFTQIISERPDFAGSSSLKEAPSFPGATYNTITVEVRTLADIIESLGLQLRRLSVVKVDVEGFTWETVVGMGDYVSNVDVFHLETETFPRHDGHHDAKSVVELMTGLGFDCVWRGYEWGPRIEDQVWVRR